ncbi:MAG: serine/threonine-protein kinase [Polyangia bacterium]
MSSEHEDLDRLGLTRTFAHDAAAQAETDVRPVVRVGRSGPHPGQPRPSSQSAGAAPADAPEPADPHIGQRIGSYRVVRELGRGGMGVVYEVVHEQLGQRAVVKTLQPELSHNQSFTQRFLTEARAISIAQHPGLVKIFDFGQLPDKTLYILMEHLAGEPLSARLVRQKLDEPTALRLARQVASTLQAAHERGVIHRDLKPANIFIVPDPEAPAGERVKLLDFGLAKINEGLPGADLRGTASGTIMGTPLYMSPEQCRGLANTDGKTDVYSLGVLLFESRLKHFSVEESAVRALGKRWGILSPARTTRCAPGFRILLRVSRRRAARGGRSREVWAKVICYRDSVTRRATNRTTRLVAGKNAERWSVLMRLLVDTASRGLVAMALVGPLLFGGCDASKAELQATKAKLDSMTTECGGWKAQLDAARASLESVKKERDDALAKLAAAAAEAAPKPAPDAASAAPVAAPSPPTAAASAQARGKKPPAGAKNTTLSNALRDKGAAVQQCAIEHALEKGAKKVVVTVRVTINNKGDVVDRLVTASVTDGDDSKVKECVEGVVRSAKFPAVPTPLATDERSWTIAAQ